MPQRNPRFRGPSQHGPSALLVAVQLPHAEDAEVSASLSELERLVLGLGLRVAGTTLQKRPNATSPSLLGEGKLRELAALTGGPGASTPGPRAHARPQEASPEASGPDGAGATRVDVVVIDSDVTPGQLRNLELALGCEVLDRTAVILRVFEQRARTQEARLEVELARLAYEAPRIRDDASLGDREGGGGRGGRGHTNVELARQRSRERMADLRRELDAARATHATHRLRRKDVPLVALVGYTNAGKSSLMRALTGSEVLVEDALFATLGTTVRALQPETTPRILVSDTVGFIRNLPHALIASFQSTLDEARDASLLLYVVDAADPELLTQLDVTRRAIDALGAAATPSLVLLNKIDRVSPEGRALLARQFPEALQTCAHDAEDLRRLRESLVAFFEAAMATETLEVPYARGALLGEVRASARIVSEEYSERGVTLVVRAPASVLARLKRLHGR
ncbi:GTPase HflX [Pyxidicoccus trucidator]|uniref:GTPase HflX n=1 Tax=Pyxidicoccus trucidator TaxID=2709662 RepID=UPI0013DA651E|nr:GTPase HflX [Pyxidicoccus trucidator]